MERIMQSELRWRTSKMEIHVEKRQRIDIEMMISKAAAEETCDKNLLQNIVTLFMCVQCACVLHEMLGKSVLVFCPEFIVNDHVNAAWY